MQISPKPISCKCSTVLALRNRRILVILGYCAGWCWENSMCLAVFVWCEFILRGVDGMSPPLSPWLWGTDASLRRCMTGSGHGTILLHTHTHPHTIMHISYLPVHTHTQSQVCTHDGKTDIPTSPTYLRKKDWQHLQNTRSQSLQLCSSRAPKWLTSDQSLQQSSWDDDFNISKHIYIYIQYIHKFKVFE